MRVLDAGCWVLKAERQKAEGGRRSWERLRDAGTEGRRDEGTVLVTGGIFLIQKKMGFDFDRQGI